MRLKNAIFFDNTLWDILLTGSRIGGEGSVNFLDGIFCASFIWYKNRFLVSSFFSDSKNLDEHFVKIIKKNHCLHF